VAGACRYRPAEWRLGKRFLHQFDVSPTVYRALEFTSNSSWNAAQQSRLISLSPDPKVFAEAIAEMLNPESRIPSPKSQVPSSRFHVYFAFHRI